MDLGPRSRTMHKQLFFKLLSSQVSAAQIPEGRYITKYQDRGFIFFVGKNRDGNLEDVIVYKLGTGTNFPTTITASRGNIAVDATNNSITLNLLDARTVSFEGDQSVLSHDASLSRKIELPGSDKIMEKNSMSDMSFTQLRQEMREMEALAARPVTSTNSATTKPRSLSPEQLNQIISQLRVQIHRQVAFSFACFGFTLIGIPLGIRVQRRETNIGFAIAIVLVLIYYSFILFGLSLSKHPEYSPHLLLWLPNILFQGIGAVLLWRANKGL